jgi:hypothetical protein
VGPSIAENAAARLWANPLVGMGATFALGTGVFAGASTYGSTEGSASTRIDAAATSAAAYTTAAAVVGLGGAVALSTAGAYRSGIEGFKGTINESIGYGATRMAHDFGRGVPDTVRGASKRTADYTKGIVSEVRSGGIRNVLERPSISGGIGAIVGGAIGHHLDSDNPGAGTAVGAVVGTGVGVLAGRFSKAEKVWSKWGRGTKIGAIVASSVVLGAALRGSSPEQYASTDRATPESNGFERTDSGVGRRMEKVGANGGLVFGLHNSR